MSAQSTAVADPMGGERLRRLGLKEYMLKLVSVKIQSKKL